MEVAPNENGAAEEEDDEPVPVRGPLFGTETMAELCVRQGRIPDAIAIYRSLLTTSAPAPNGAAEQERRERWTQRLEALRSPAAAVNQTPKTTPTPPALTRPAAASLPRTGATAAPGAASTAAPPGRPTLGAAPRGAIHRLPLIIREPVRAGQIVYAEKNDLIVVGPVNPGAQLIADGNIHVYGRLRGRAVAGAHGAREARIYCQRLEAELVGVDSAYLTAEDIPPERYGLSVQVFWQDERCVIAPL